MALYDAGRDQEAVQALLACLPLFAAHEQPTRKYAALCANLGAALAECGQPAAAENAVGEALQIARRLGDDLAQARAHFNRGNLARQSLSRQACHDHFDATTPLLGQGWQLTICSSAGCWLQRGRRPPRGPTPLPALVVADCGALQVHTPLLPGLVEAGDGELLPAPAESLQAMAYDALQGARQEGRP